MPEEGKGGKERRTEKRRKRGGRRTEVLCKQYFRFNIKKMVIPVSHHMAWNDL